jgi:hypothetical protein
MVNRQFVMLFYKLFLNRFPFLGKMYESVHCPPSHSTVNLTHHGDEQDQNIDYSG